MWFFLNLYLQQVLHFGPFAAGAALVPMTAAMMILMVSVTARLVARLGFKPPIVAGLVVLAAGVALLSRVRPDGNFLADVLPATLVAAVGMALAYIPAMMAALAGARPEEGGLASGIVNTTYQVGSALGLAALTAVAAAWGIGQDGDPTALVAGFHAAFVGAAGIALVAAAFALVTLRQPAPAATAADATAREAQMAD